MIRILTHAHHDENDTRIPAVGQCACGLKVTLRGFTNTCDCGREYNSAGQELAPRAQWGEETGEHWTEIMNGEG